MNEFDIKAAGWDQNQMHWDRSEAVAKEIIKHIPLNKQMTALEFGAGTGITSFYLKDNLKEITLMDNSSEMVKIMSRKIETSGAKNLNFVNFDLEHSDYREKKFDLVFTQMVLHHIANTEDIIIKFHSILNPGGYLAIADLYPEDGSFHGAGFNGHLGFDLSNLSGLLLRNGFEKTSHNQCYVIKREVSETETKSYNVFLLTANRI